MTQQVATVDQIQKIQNAVGLNEFSVEQLATLKNTIAKSLSLQDFSVFLTLSKSHDLNPFHKEIWAYKDSKGNLVTFAGRDGFLKRAKRDPNYRGLQSMAVYENDNFISRPHEENPEKMITHEIKSLTKSSRGKLLGAWCIVKMNGIRPFLAIAMLEDYTRNSPTWKSHPEAMIIKVAETNALKKATGITGLASEYDYDIGPGHVAIPFDKSGANDSAVEKAVYSEVGDKDDSDLAKAREIGKEMIEIFSKYPDNADLIVIKEMCKEKQKNKEFTLQFAENTLQKVEEIVESIVEIKDDGDETE